MPNDDFETQISNKTVTKRAKGINEIKTINNINYCIPLVRVKSAHYEFCNPLTVSKFPMFNTKRNNKRFAYNSSSTILTNTHYSLRLIIKKLTKYYASKIIKPQMQQIQYMQLLPIEKL